MDIGIISKPLQSIIDSMNQQRCRQRVQVYRYETGKLLLLIKVSGVCFNIRTEIYNDFSIKHTKGKTLEKYGYMYDLYIRAVESDIFREILEAQKKLWTVSTVDLADEVLEEVQGRVREFMEEYRWKKNI